MQLYNGWKWWKFLTLQFWSAIPYPFFYHCFIYESYWYFCENYNLSNVAMGEKMKIVNLNNSEALFPI